MITTVILHEIGPAKEDETTPLLKNPSVPDSNHDGSPKQDDRTQKTLDRVRKGTLMAQASFDQSIIHTTKSGPAVIETSTDNYLLSRYRCSVKQT